jgi:ParB family transcriptional regulator, chromosome partitioning protein
MESSKPNRIREIPLDRIQILNPRTRGRRQHQAIVDSIAAVGLKRPITVSRRVSESGSEECYDLVCGQGRLEAVRMLGHSSIPAIVVERDKEDCLVMSLVENIARRNHSPHELLEDIRSLRSQGYPDDTIAEKIGLTPGYLRNLMTLLDQGEERLIAAVENGVISINLALDIARADDAAVQSALADAYTDGTLKGRQLATVRKLIERRARSRRQGRQPTGPSDARQHTPLTSEQLRKMYIRESERLSILAKKAELASTRLAILVQALRELMRDTGFVELLEREGLATVPRILEQRITGEVSSWKH